MQSRTAFRHSLRILWGIVVLILAFAPVMPVQAANGYPDETPPENPGGASIQSTSAYSKIFLPLVTNSENNVEPPGSNHETYRVNAAERTLKALGGRLTIYFPMGSINDNCTLDIQTPDRTEPWLSVSMSLPTCDVDTGGLYQFQRPVTISMDYSGVSLTYIDESRLKIGEFPYTADLPSADAPAETDGAAADVVDPAAKTVSRQTKYLGSFYLQPGGQITDMGTGPGGSVYAASAPLVYQVLPGQQLQKFANLDEIDHTSGLSHLFYRFAVNSANGEIYLSLSGTSQTVYALNGSSLRSVYTIPAGEDFWSLAYRPGDNLIYLSLSRTTGNWFGCPTRDIFVRAIKPEDGSVVGEIAKSGLNNGFKGLVVDSNGRLQASVSDKGCFDSSLYTGSTLVSADGFSTLSALSHGYSGFRGVEFLAADAQGQTYLSNNSADMISVVSGELQDVVGGMSVSKPGPLAISGSTLYVVSNGFITTRSKNIFDPVDSAGFSISPSASLSGTDLNAAVKASHFSPVPAHNVLYYNGNRSILTDVAEHDFTGQEQELAYPINLGKIPDLNTLTPAEQQKGYLEFRINGVDVFGANVHAPQLPYQTLTLNADNITLTVARGDWVVLSGNGSILTSQEGLFPASSKGVLYQFNQLGEFNFVTGGSSPYHARVTVTPFGQPISVSKTIDPAQGGILWASGGALEIPAGALPDHSGGYQVTYTTAANNFDVAGNLSERSLVQKFSFTPEPAHLNKDIVLHIPRKDDSSTLPPMAVYDSQVYDSYPITSYADPQLSAHLSFTIPAGDYVASDIATGDTSLDINAAKMNIFQRGLNALGDTGVWYAFGLPDDGLVSDHFMILYNSHDCSDEYAGVLKDALEKSYDHFKAMNFTMPDNRVIVKVASLITSDKRMGITPGIGLYGNFYIFVHNELNEATLETTAAHEFMHVLQKTNATIAGRYMNTKWWEEATAVWAQYEVYPEYDVYNMATIHGSGESFLRTPVSSWNSMDVEKLNALMSMAAYLQKVYSSTAVRESFQNLQADWDAVTGIQKSIEIVTGKPFGEFYAEFSKYYWMQKFAPVNTWDFVTDHFTYGEYEKNDIYPFILEHASNSINRGNIPQLSSGAYKIYYTGATDLHTLATDATANGSVIRISNSCTGMKYYFYDASKNLIDTLKFEDASTAPYDQLYYSTKLGALTIDSPLYMVYIDSSYNYAADCSPTVYLDEPYISSVYPNPVFKNTPAQTITITGSGFGPSQGSVIIGGSHTTVTSWSENSITVNWNTGSNPGTAKVQVTHKLGATSNLWSSITIY